MKVEMIILGFAILTTTKILTPETRGLAVGGECHGLLRTHWQDSLTISRGLVGTPVTATGYQWNCCIDFAISLTTCENCQAMLKRKQEMRRNPEVAQ